MDTLQDDYPGNVIKSHGRKTSVMVFIRLRKPDNDAARKALQTSFCNWVELSLQPQLTFFKEQLEQSNRFKEEGVKGGATSFVSLGISRQGFGRLKVDQGLIPKDPVHNKYFSYSMLESTISGNFWAYLSGSKEQSTIEDKFKITSDGIHLVVLIANDDKGELLNTMAKIFLSEHFDACVEKCFLEVGHKGEGGRGPLGFRDNISNEDEVPKIYEKTRVYDSTTPEKGHSPIGTFMVYQKIGVNKKSFSDIVSRIKAEIELPESLAETYSKKDMAEAYLIGRFRDGKPLLFADKKGSFTEQNFKYSTEGEGDRKNKCPFSAHIRSANPRARNGALPKDQHSGIIRRGVNFSYQDTDEGEPVSGLHFISYQRSVSELALVMRRMRRVSEGIDAAFNRLSSEQNTAKFPKIWGQDEEFEITLNGRKISSLLGGEIFFMPSKHYLEKVLRQL